MVVATQRDSVLLAVRTALWRPYFKSTARVTPQGMKPNSKTARETRTNRSPSDPVTEGARFSPQLARYDHSSMKIETAHNPFRVWFHITRPDSQAIYVLRGQGCEKPRWLIRGSFLQPGTAPSVRPSHRLCLGNWGNGTGLLALWVLSRVSAGRRFEEEKRLLRFLLPATLRSLSYSFFVCEGHKQSSVWGLNCLPLTLL